MRQFDLEGSEGAIENGPNSEQMAALKARIQVYFDMFADGETDPTVFNAHMARLGGAKALAAKMMAIAIAAWEQDTSIDFSKVIFSFKEVDASGQTENGGIRFIREYKEPEPNKELTKLLDGLFREMRATHRAPLEKGLDPQSACDEPADGEE